MQGGLLLGVVVGKSAAIFQGHACTDEHLLVGAGGEGGEGWGGAFLTLGLGLYFLDGVTGPTSREMVWPVRVFMEICILTC